MNQPLCAPARPAAYRLTGGRALVLYFTLAILFTWAVKIPAIFIPGWPGLLSFLGSFGPAFAAVTVLLLSGRRAELAATLRSLVQWKVHPAWYLAALVIPVVMIAGCILVAWLLMQASVFAGAGDHPLASLAAGQPGPAVLPLVFLGLSNFIYLMIIVWGEEVGWRGYALPHLQARMHPLAASLVLGVIWGAWHLPNFWMPGSFQQPFPIPIYLVYILGHTIIYTWLYNGTKGSLLLTGIHHAATNAFLISTAVLPAFKLVVAFPVSCLVVVAVLDAVVIGLTRGGLGIKA